MHTEPRLVRFIRRLHRRADAQTATERRLHFESLEARILYSAAPVEGGEAQTPSPIEEGEPIADHVASSFSESVHPELELPNAPSTTDDVAEIPAEPEITDESQFFSIGPDSIVIGADDAEEPAELFYSLSPEHETTVLTQEQVEDLAAAAAERWGKTGLTAEQSTALANVTYQLADLSGNFLGAMEGDVITIDLDAAGRDWFVDATPLEDEEFVSSPDSPTRLIAEMDSAADNKVDLLSILLHEQGHILGLDDISASVNSGDVMNQWFVESERRVATDGQAEGAVAGSLEGVHHASLAGDIAFVGYNADGDKDFAIVALSDIAANSIIYFTDNEPSESGGLIDTNEGVLTWNSGESVLSAGTVVIFTDLDNDSNPNFGASIGDLARTSGNFNPAVGGDGIYAYLGTDNVNPTTFLAAIANDDFGSAETGTPANAGLSKGTTAVEFNTTNHDGGVYTGPRSGKASFSEYLAEIGDPTNWSTNSSDGETLLPFSTTSFTVTSSPPTTVYVKNTWTEQSDITDGDGDLEAAGTQTATFGTNAFGDLATAIANLDTTQPVTLIVNAGTYGDLDLSGLTNNVTVKIVEDQAAGSASTTIGELTGSNNVTLELGNIDGTHTTATSLTVASGNFEGVISGDGGLVKTGTGTLTLGGANSYAGTTTIAAGRLSATNSGALGTSSVALDGGILRTNVSLTNDISLDDVTTSFSNTIEVDGNYHILSGKISGAGGLTVGEVGGGADGLALSNSANDFQGDVSFTGDNVYLRLDADEVITDTATIYLNGNALKLQGENRTETIAGLSGDGRIFASNSGNGPTLRVGAGDATSEFSGQFGGGGGANDKNINLEKIGSGTLTLSGSNSNYTGTTTITAGRLFTTDSAALGASSLVMNGGILKTNVSLANDISLDDVTTTTSNAIEVDGNYHVLSGKIAGAGGLTVDEVGGGSDGLALSNSANDFQGDVTITGTSVFLRLDANEVIPDTASVFVGAGGNLRIEGDGRTETIAGLNGSGRIFASSPTIESMLIVGSGNATSEFSGYIGGGNANNKNISLEKIGDGTLTLSASNSNYTGSTTVSSGTLLVTGDSSSTTGQVTVNANATLGGTGTVGGDVTIDDDGILAPGVSGAGTLTVGNLILNGDLQTQINGVDTAGTDYDQLIVDGTVTLGATAALVASGSTSSNGTITILSNDSTDAIGGSAAFSNFAEGDTVTVNGKNFFITYAGDTDSNDVVLTPAPAPTTVYVDATFTGDGTVDGDQEAANSQDATLGRDAFATIADALNALSTTESATLIINSGTYGALDLSGFTNDVTIKFVEGNSSITSLTGGANVAIHLDDDAEHSFATTLTVGDDTDTTYSGTISGTGGLTKTGSGILTLTGTSTFSGATAVDNGTLRLNKSGASFNAGLFTNTSSITIATNATLEVTSSWNVKDTTPVVVNGGVLHVTSAANYLNDLTLNDGALISGNLFRVGYSRDASITVGGSSASTISADIYLVNNSNNTGIRQVTFNVADLATGTDLVVSGVIRDLGQNGTSPTLLGTDLVKTGGGTLTLSGANTYTGNVNVNAGTAVIGNRYAFGTLDTAVTKVNVASGATVDFNGVNSATYGYTIAGTGVGGNGALVNNGSTLGTGIAQASNITLAADATIGGTGDWALLAASYGATTLDLAGFTLTKAGSNTFTLVNATVTAGALNISEGTVTQYDHNDQNPDGHDLKDVAVTLADTAGATLNLNDLNLSVGSLGGGGSTGGNVSLGSGTLTVGNLNTDTSYSGVISGDGGVTKIGTGTLTVGGTITALGETTISDGVLKLGADGALGDSSSGKTVINGGTLDIAGFRAIGELVEAQGTGYLDQGAITSTGVISQANAFNNLVFTGDTTINNPTDFRFDVYGNVDMGGYTVTKIGGGLIYFKKITLANPGNVIISGGRFYLEEYTDFDGTGTITVESGGILYLNRSQHADGSDITHDGGLVLNHGSFLFSGSYLGVDVYPTIAGDVTLGSGTTTISTNNGTAASGETEPSKAHLTLSGDISGAGGLNKSGPNSLTLSGNNSYTGDTNVTNGSLILNSTGTAIAGTLKIGASGSVQLAASDQIADSATVEITNGGTMDLTGIDSVTVLKIGGVAQADGTYGATGSGATFINDSVFSGTGVLAVGVSTLSISDATATEGTDSHVEFEFSLDKPSPVDLAFSLVLAGSGGTPATIGTDTGSGMEFSTNGGTDWSAVTGNVTLTAGATSLLVRTSVTDDFLADDGETFTLTATLESGALTNTGPETATATLSDDTDTALVTISGPATVNEGDTTATYTVTVDQTPVSDITVNLSYSGTATGSDYTQQASVTILANTTSATFTLPTDDDSDVDPDETIVIDLDSVTGGGFEAIAEGATNQVTTVIADNDVVSSTTVYVDATFTGSGTVDGDQEAAGSQDATIGTDAFATIADALDALSTTEPATLIINSGSYDALDLSGFSNNVTVKFVEGDSTIASLTGGANVAIHLDDDAEHSFATTLTVGDGSDTVFAGVISGNGSLQKIGSGELTLTGQSTFSGDTRLDEGTLTLAASGGATLASGSDLSVGDPVLTESSPPAGSVQAVIDRGAADVNLNVQADQSFARLTFARPSASQHDLTIDSGVTLTVTSGFTVSTKTEFQDSSGNRSVPGSIKLVVTGEGTLTQTGGDFRVENDGSFTLNTMPAELDMSGLATFSASVSSFLVGSGNAMGSVHLAQDSAISTTNRFYVGAYGNSSPHDSYLILGQTTVINTDDMQVGVKKTNGTVRFADGLVGATLTLRGEGGTGGPALVMGDRIYNGGIGSDAGGLLDFSGGAADVAFGSILLGKTGSSSGTSSGSGFGTILLDAGDVLTAESLTMSETDPTPGSNPNMTSRGTLTIGTGASATIGTLTLGSRQSESDTPIDATVNVDGGTLTVDKLQGGADQNNSPNDSRVVNLTSGTLAVGSFDQVPVTGVTAGPVVLNLDGGTLTHLAGEDLTIASLFDLQVLSASTILTDTGRSISISEVLDGAGALTKSGSGTLTLSAENTYAGGTTVSGGTLFATNTAGSATGSSSVTVENGGTLAGTGIISGQTTVESGGILAPGVDGIGTLTLAGGGIVNGSVILEVDGTGAGTADFLDVVGTLTVSGATMDVRVSGAAPDDAAYTLASFGTLTGADTTTDLVPAGYELIDRGGEILLVDLADSPTVTSPTTQEDTPTTVTVTRAPGDHATHFQVTNIAGGSITGVNEGDFVAFGSGGSVALTFTPAPDASDPGTFGVDVQASRSADVSGLGGAIVSSTISVTPVAGSPDLAVASLAIDPTVGVPTSLGLSFTAGDPTDTDETVIVTVSGIPAGTEILLGDPTLFLSTSANSGDVSDGSDLVLELDRSQFAAATDLDVSLTFAAPVADLDLTITSVSTDGVATATQTTVLRANATNAPRGEGGAPPATPKTTDDAGSTGTPTQSTPSESGNSSSGSGPEANLNDLFDALRTNSAINEAESGLGLSSSTRPSLELFVGVQMSGLDESGLPSQRVSYFAFVGGESGSTVEINLRSGDRLLTSGRGTVDGNGNFELQLTSVFDDGGFYVAEVTVTPPPLPGIDPRPSEVYYVEFNGGILPTLSELQSLEEGDIFGQMLQAIRSPNGPVALA